MSNHKHVKWMCYDTFYGSVIMVCYLCEPIHGLWNVSWQHFILGTGGMLSKLPSNSNSIPRYYNYKANPKIQMKNKVMKNAFHKLLIQKMSQRVFKKCRFKMTTLYWTYNFTLTENNMWTLLYLYPRGEVWFLNYPRLAIPFRPVAVFTRTPILSMAFNGI